MKIGHIHRFAIVITPRSLLAVSSFLLFALLTTHYSLRTLAQVPEAKDVVSAAAYPSFDPAARGTSLQLAVVLKIRNGFHVNAHQASADYLIATSITPQLPAGFKAGEVVYPKGELHTFSFTKTPLNVYQDKVIVRIPLTALPDAPTGTQHIPLKLRYQACNNELCLPPVKIDVDATVTIAPNSSAVRPSHPELFPPH